MCSGLDRSRSRTGAEVAQRYAFRQSPADLFGDRLRQQHLTTVSRAHDARGAINRAAIEVAVASFIDPRMQAAAQWQRHSVRCIRRGKQLLYLERGD